jgi:ATP:ADP antiporter, AAA family
VGEGQLYRVLRKFVDVRPQEARSALYLFLYFFLITFTFYIIKAVKENFVIGINPRLWPVADLITAVLIGFVVAWNARLLNRLPRKTYASRTLVFFVSNLLLFWFVFWLYTQRTFGISALLVLSKTDLVHIGSVLAFSFWSDLFIAMSVTQFWIARNDVFKLHQAKRTVGFLVTGGLLGGIAGSLLTYGLVHLINPVNLILICPATLLLTLVVVNLLHAERERVQDGSTARPTLAGSGSGYLESLRTVRRDRYLLILAGVLASSMVVGQLIKYQFQFIVKSNYPNSGERTAFLAFFFLAILVISTVFHLFTTGQLLKRFGIRLTLLVAPAVLLVAALAAFFIPVAALGALMVWACGIRGSERAFDTTVGQSARELLYIPIADEIKYKAKIFIDMFVSKLGTGLGAALYLLLYYGLSLYLYVERPGEQPGIPVRYFGLLVVVFAIIWIVLTWIIYAEYLGAVKQDLQEKWPDPNKLIQAHVDMDSTLLLFELLQSRQKSSTLYAMNLFRLKQMEKLTPEVMEVLAFKEDELKAMSMDSLLDVGGQVFYPGMEETMTADDFEVMVREIAALPSYKLLMEQHLGGAAGTKTETEVARMEAARLTGLMEPTPGVLQSLARLLRDPSPDVLNYALDSAAIHLQKDHIPLMIPLLGNPMTRQAAQCALAAFGPRVMDILRKHLQDPQEPWDVRKAVPEVLTRFGNQKAADILVAQLCLREAELEEGLVQALREIRLEFPDVQFREKKISEVILSLIRTNYAAILSAAGGPAGEGGGHSLPQGKAAVDLRTKRIFDLLTLVHPPDDIVKAYQNILQGTKKSVDSSLELLDNILDRTTKTYLFPLIEDLPPGEREHRLKKLAKGLGGVSP